MQPLNAFQDEEFFAAISMLSDVTGESRSELLEGFGRHMAAPLLSQHRALIPADWTALDLIERTEPCIHTIIRNAGQGTPPFIRCWRTPDDAVRIMYNSPRQMCGFAKGLIRGIGEQFGEVLAVVEGRCLHNGDPYCELFVRSNVRKTTPYVNNVQMLRVHPSVVEEAVDIVTRHLIESSIDNDTISEIALSTIEGIGNVVRHAKCGRCELAIHVEEDIIKLEITDYGHGFTLAHRAMPDPLEESGRGIALMQMICDSVDYERRPDSNCLTVLKRVKASLRVDKVA